MAELTAAKKAETEAVKHFISKREDIYRVDYGKRVTKFPRQCVFFGTTNEMDFLKDKTGNRRFWPVMVDKNRIKKDLWKEDIKAVSLVPRTQAKAQLRTQLKPSNNKG